MKQFVRKTKLKIFLIKKKFHIVGKTPLNVSIFKQYEKFIIVVEFYAKKRKIQPIFK